jgi:hypothetical protein
VVGSAVALAGTGWAIELLHSNRLIFGIFKPWQALFIGTGVPGFALALLSFTIADPRRQARALRGDAPPRSSFTRYMLGRRRLYAGIFLGVGFIVGISYALLGWVPTYLMRILKMPPQTAGLTFALIVIIAGVIGQMMSGLVVDAMTARGIKDAPLRYLMAVSVISAVPSIAAFLVSGDALFIALVSVFCLLSLPMMGYSAAAVQMVTPPEFRGRASAAFLFTVTIMGVTLGTLGVGFLTDVVFRNPAHLGWSLCCVVALLSPLGIATLGWGLKPLRDAIRY